jgi:3-isopropylmalate/(R)-2-methylmalate dehydratase small subunit
LTVDLETQTITDESGLRFEFRVDPFRRECLLNGWDDIGLTLRIADRIAAYEQSHHPSATMYAPVDPSTGKAGH